MEKEFVPYELAVKLKALGFDENTLCVYNSYEQLKSVIISSIDGDYIKKDKWDDRLPAPTFSQAFRWFRDKYGLYDTISKNGYMIEGETNSGFLRITRLTLNSHEEAELACLDKLIEIVEQKEK